MHYGPSVAYFVQLKVKKAFLDHNQEEYERREFRTGNNRNHVLLIILSRFGRNKRSM
jgi:hypothetical protein